jgi:hypothetical protein
MSEPTLYGLQVVYGAQDDPAVAEVAEDALGVEFPDVGVVGEERVAFAEGVGVFRRRR